MIENKTGKKSNPKPQNPSHSGGKEGKIQTQKTNQLAFLITDVNNTLQTNILQSRWKIMDLT